MDNIISVKERFPILDGSYLVYSPTQFPKNSRWLVAEYYNDVECFYSESDEFAIEDVTHWTELPDDPKLPPA